ncbi:MAG: hypothetical protein ACRBB4_12875 [Neptuniibacter sp.]|uniref:hypothetical protein n=1 Tax=Neptuniibacter sp. TaxID=1962643 RepID=UPI003B59816A
MKLVTARVGAILYIIWGLLHIMAASAIYELALTTESDIQGRLFQSAWNLMYLAIMVIVVAIIFNWRQKRVGYWLTLFTVSISDIGFILFILVPGYLSWWPGVIGPLLWIAAALISTVSLNRGSEASVSV